MELIEVPCKYCKRPTRMVETKCCDACWELARRVVANPDLTRRILRDLSKGKAP